MDPKLCRILALGLFAGALGADVVAAWLGGGSIAAGLFVVVAGWLLTRPGPIRAAAGFATLACGVAVLLLVRSDSLASIALASCISPSLSLVLAARWLASPSTGPRLFPPTIIGLRLASVVAVSIACLILVLVAASSGATARMNEADKERVVSAVGWLVLMTAMLPLQALRLSANGSFPLRWPLVLGALAVVAGALDGLGPVRLAAAAVVAGAAGSFSGLSSEMPRENTPLDGQTFSVLLLKYAVASTLFLALAIVVARSA